MTRAYDTNMVKSPENYATMLNTKSQARPDCLEGARHVNTFIYAWLSSLKKRRDAGRFKTHPFPKDFVGLGLRVGGLPMVGSSNERDASNTRQKKTQRILERPVTQVSHDWTIL